MTNMSKFKFLAGEMLDAASAFIRRCTVIFPARYASGDILKAEAWRL